MKKTIIIITCFFFFISQLYPQTIAENGMVVSSSELASDVGVKILKEGGNAIDATVATAFALAVTHPEAGNIGGGGFLVYMDSSGFATSIDFRERAPLKATEEMYVDENGNLKKAKNILGLETTANHAGLKSVGVPGTVAGLYLAHQKYGSMAWEDLIQPAIDLAQNGIELSWNHYNHILYFKRIKTETKLDYSDFLINYFNNENGEFPEFGEIWKQPELANTLIQIRDNGHDGFYKGEVAKEIARYMKENGGIITQKDLKEYKAIERSPVKGTFKGYDIYSMGPPSSGGIILIEMLNMMENANLDSIKFNSSDYVHLISEVMRRAYADRAEHLGDPEFNPDMPVDKLISKEYALKRFQSIDMNIASKSDSLAFGQAYESLNTTHLSVIDKNGNAVSLTYTLEGMYGSGMGSAKLGFLFNNEMGDFNPVPGLTNNEGLIGTKPNIIQPGKRMLSSMTPTIVSRNNKPVLIIGSPGGRTIINTVFQTILCFTAYEMYVYDAIESMKIHHQWLPDQIVYEIHKLSPDTREILEQKGHKMKKTNELGELMGIEIDQNTNFYIGVSDSSSPEGAAKGY